MSKHPQCDTIWADEDGLQLRLTHTPHNGVVVTIVNIQARVKIAVCTIANHRVKRIVDFASAVAAMHDRAVLDQQEKPT